MKKIIYLVCIGLLVACSEQPKEKVHLQSVQLEEGEEEEIIEEPVEEQVPVEDYFYYVKASYDYDYYPRDAEMQLQISEQGKVIGWVMFTTEYPAFSVIEGTRSGKNLDLKFTGTAWVEGARGTWEEKWVIQSDGRLEPQGDGNIRWLEKNKTYYPTTKQSLKYSTLFKTTVSNLRLRTHPSLDAAVELSVPEETPLIHLGEKSSHRTEVVLRGQRFNEPWYKVSHEKSNTTGWAYGGALETIGVAEFHRLYRSNAWRTGKYVFEPVGNDDTPLAIPCETLILIDENQKMEGWMNCYVAEEHEYNYFSKNRVCLQTKLSGRVEGEQLVVDFEEYPEFNGEVWQMDFDKLPFPSDGLIATKDLNCLENRKPRQIWLRSNHDKNLFRRITKQYPKRRSTAGNNKPDVSLIEQGKVQEYLSISICNFCSKNHSSISVRDCLNLYIDELVDGDAEKLMGFKRGSREAYIIFNYLDGDFNEYELPARLIHQCAVVTSIE